MCILLFPRVPVWPSGLAQHRVWPKRWPVPVSPQRGREELRHVRPVHLPFRAQRLQGSELCDQVWTEESDELEPPVELVLVSCVVRSVRLWPSGLAGSLLWSADGTVYLLPRGVRPTVRPLSAGPLGLPHVSALLLQRTHRWVRGRHRPLHRLPGPQHRTRLRQVSWRTATPVTCDRNRL